MIYKNFRIDFFGIGAAKCGSTWLATCLNEHPQITIAKSKEPNFFVKKLSVFGGELNENYMKDWNLYKAQFSHAKENSKLGDMSVNLMHNIPEAPENIKNFFPEAKFIVMLRDPVKRTYSHYWHEKFRDRVPGVPDTFEEALTNKELLFRSSYYEQLSEWFKFFPKNRFFIILDIDLKKNVLSVWKSLCLFLDIDPNFIPLSLHKKINEANKMTWYFYYSKKLFTFLKNKRLQSLIDASRKIKINEILKKHAHTKFTYPPMKPQTEKKLREYFFPDICKLEKLINRDLSEWKQK